MYYHLYNNSLFIGFIHLIHLIKLNVFLQDADKAILIDVKTGHYMIRVYN